MDTKRENFLLLCTTDLQDNIKHLKKWDSNYHLLEPCNGVVIFDEMTIKKLISYDKEWDFEEGLQDHREFGSINSEQFMYHHVL